MSLDAFLSPRSVAVVGASQAPAKLGSIITQNIVEGGFTGDLYGINPKHPGETIRTIPFYDSLTSAPAVDLAVIVIPSRFVESVVDEAITVGTKSLIIISAGFKEVGETELEDRIAQKCQKAGIRLLGPNCLGAMLPYLGLNASFADGFPQKGNVCFISQSGAFCTAALDWALDKNIGFSHFLSLGNKADIGEVDLLEHLAKDPQVEIFAFYLESLQDGSQFLETLRKITPQKPVIILEPGKSSKASQASSSHTGSLAPNFRVMQTAYASAGAIQVETMEEMFDTIEILHKHPNQSFGPRVVMITNAGGVGVMSTDLCEDNGLELPKLSSQTITTLQASLPPESSLHNPIDIIGDAGADRYEAALASVIEDPEIDQILVLLTPQRNTEVLETAKVIQTYANKTDKYIAACFIGGKKTQPGLAFLQQHTIPAYPFPNEALRVMGLLARYEQSKNRSREYEVGSTKKNKNLKSPTPYCLLPSSSTKSIQAHLSQAKAQSWPSLGQDQVYEVMKAYGIPHPQAGQFTDLDKALAFAQQIFPGKVVLKISSPQALHKTELKGIRLNINDQKTFTEAWEHLSGAIQKAHLSEAHIQVQEQASAEAEVFIGVHTDPHFGRIMVFGSGGIYTETLQDTSVSLLPVRSFEKLIDQTKMGHILSGVRGEKAKAIPALVDLMQRLQQLVLDFPDIEGLDLNPVMVGEDEVMVVDMKVLVDSDAKSGNEN